MSNKDYEFLYRKAEVLKAIAHPVRLSILRDLVENGEKKAGDLDTGIKLPAASVSQHLAKMSYIGIFNKRRQGTNIYYSLINDDRIAEMIKAFI